MQISNDKMRNLNGIDWLALLLLVVGGLNWGLVGLLNFNLVTTLFGSLSGVTRIVYILVGLAAIYVLFSLGRLGKR